MSRNQALLDNLDAGVVALEREIASLNESPTSVKHESNHAGVKRRLDEMVDVKPILPTAKRSRPKAEDYL